jgi:hypothetical protein
MRDPAVIQSRTLVITSRVRLPRLILATQKLKRNRPLVNARDVRPASHRRVNRHGGILAVGVDELVECVGLVGVAARVGPGDLGVFPGHGCAEGVVGVLVGVLVGERLCYVVVEGDFRVELLCVGGFAVG